MAPEIVSYQASVRDLDPKTAGDPSTLRVAVREAMIHERMKKGCDYQGTGSEAEPIRFRPGLDYHMAYRKVCEQLGVARTDRRICFFSGTIGDVVRSGGAEVYFSTLPLTRD